MSDRVQEARECVEQAISNYAIEHEYGDEIRTDPWTALDAYAAAVRSATLAEVRRVVQEWGEPYAYCPDLISTLDRMEATDEPS